MPDLCQGKGGIRRSWRPFSSAGHCVPNILEIGTIPWQLHIFTAENGRHIYFSHNVISAVTKNILNAGKFNLKKLAKH